MNEWQTPPWDCYQPEEPEPKEVVESGSEIPSFFKNGKKEWVVNIKNLTWQCKYCGENDKPKCYKCVREDGKIVTDELQGRE